MTIVLQLLALKGRDVLSARPEDTVYDAIKKMADENVGSLVVMKRASSLESSLNVTTRGMCS